MSISSRLKSARRYTDDCGIRSARALALLTFALAATGCRDAIAPSLAPARAPASVETAGAITSSAIEFAAQVRAAGSRNQILISLRELNGPVISSEELERLSSGAPIRVALPEAAAISVRRNSAAGPVSNGTRQAVLNLLARFGLQPDFPTRVLPMYAVSPSDSALEPLVAALLKSPHVDYLSVAEARAATPRGGPLGSNPADAKHDYHNIQAVWDSTRGEGGVVGVFDSGLAFGGSPEQYDLDAGYLGVVNGQKRGIIARGFVGRYAVSCPLAERTAGLC